MTNHGRRTGDIAAVLAVPSGTHESRAAASHCNGGGGGGGEGKGRGQKQGVA